MTNIRLEHLQPKMKVAGILPDPVTLLPVTSHEESVEGEMLTRQPLRFLLADDPGAGKTIMAGLLVKELIVHGDVNRCLICAPGSLAEQWQDELWQKFHLRFEILTRERINASFSGNPFADDDLLMTATPHGVTVIHPHHQFQ